MSRRNKLRTLSAPLSLRAGLAMLLPAALLCAGSILAFGKEGLDRNGRIALIRGLDHEVAVAKIALPRGKHGVLINDRGQLDQARVKDEMMMNGVAISPGMPVEITKINFKSDKIIFEINGGGKNQDKWYQHIKVGVGDMAEPITDRRPMVAYGSSITLSFHDQKLSSLSVSQAKHLLSAVLDFHRQLPTDLYSPSVPARFKEAIKKHQVELGMDRDAVLSSKGDPDRKVRQTDKEGVETEDWLYGVPPHVLFVTFSGDVVVSVHQY